MVDNTNTVGVQESLSGKKYHKQIHSDTAHMTCEF